MRLKLWAKSGREVVKARRQGEMWRRWLWVWNVLSGYEKLDPVFIVQTSGSCLGFFFSRGSEICALQRKAHREESALPRLLKDRGYILLGVPKFII
jgi:hypothetical protein